MGIGRKENGQKRYDYHGCYCDRCRSADRRIFRMSQKDLLRRNAACMTGAVCLYLLNRFFLKDMIDGTLGYFLRCHFNDLLCPLVVIPACQIVLLVFLRTSMRKIGTLLLFFLACAVVWEFVIPLVKTGSTADMWDVVCYLGGTMLYWCYA